jgi:hypothetical protein
MNHLARTQHNQMERTVGFARLPLSAETSNAESVGFNHDESVGSNHAESAATQNGVGSSVKSATTPNKNRQNERVLGA